MQYTDTFVEKRDIQGILREQLEKTNAILSQETIQDVKKMIEFVDDKIYNLHTAQPHQYFEFIWNFQSEKQPQYQQIILNGVDERLNNVLDDIMNDKLQIQSRHQNLHKFDFQAELKQIKVNLLKDQSDLIKKKIDEINSHLHGISKDQQKSKNQIIPIHMDEQKRKQYEQFLKKNKQEKQQRMKKLKQQKKKQEDQLLKKQNQIKQQNQKDMKQKRQEIIKKQKQLHEIRDKERALRDQRKSQFIKLKQQYATKPPLFQRIENDYSKRYKEFAEQERQRFLSQRKAVFEHIDDMKLDEHQKFYEKIKEEREMKRKQKLNELERQEKSRVKFYSSYDLTNDVKSQKQVEEKQIAKEKYEKMKQYKEIVKEKYRPKVDQNKRKELMNLMQEMELRQKKMKRVKLQNGSFVYQQLKQSDPRMMGIEYLQSVKQMANKMKMMGRRKNSQQLPKTEEKRFKNYLQELKNMPKTRKSRGRFIDYKNLTYDQKIKKVQLQSEKLLQITRQKEMKLKFGKFKTSDEILQCKEQIDQNYLQIVKMKLQLVNLQDNNNK